MSAAELRRMAEEVLVSLLKAEKKAARMNAFGYLGEIRAELEKLESIRAILSERIIDERLFSPTPLFKKTPRCFGGRRDLTKALYLEDLKKDER